MGQPVEEISIVAELVILCSRFLSRVLRHIEACCSKINQIQCSHS